MGADGPRIRPYRATDHGAAGQLTAIRAVSAEIRGDVAVVTRDGHGTNQPLLYRG